MRDYIILNGVNSNTITGLLISKLPPITKPKIRTQTEEIDGRDGDIITKLGYSAYDKEIQIGLYGNFNINQVIAYFNTSGTVTFSNEPDKYYNYQILDQIDYDKLIRFKTAKVKMHVQPFKYPLVETPVEINIQNVTGSGEAVDINNTADAPITLALKGNTSQDGTPTPEAPVEVQTVTGRQEIDIVGKNLWNEDNQAFINQSRFNLSKDSNNIWTFTVQSDGYAFAISTITLSAGTYFFSSNCTGGNTVILKENVTQNNPFTLTEEAVITYRVYKSGAVTGDVIKLSNVMLEKNSEGTTYEPYKSQSYELDLGKNLSKITNFTRESNGLTGVFSTDGTITISGTATNSSFLATNDYIFLSKGTYTLSANNNVALSSGTDAIRIIDSGGSLISGTSCALNNINGKQTFTLNQDYKNCRIQARFDSGTSFTNNFILRPQLEKGSTATSYAPYKTPIEVCKIGDYQDYIYKDNNKWYLHKEIKRLVLNGSETTINTASNNRFRVYLTTNYAKARSDTINVMSDKLIGVSQATTATTTTNFVISANNDSFFVRNTTTSSVEDFRTWLSTNTPIIYYLLATPEDEEITDNTLIGQLNALENARSYDTTTHINQNTPNKPFIINATAVQKGSDTGTVNNIGNIYAKPTIDVEGSGTVEIYLNGNQMFSVDLSSSNECILDTANLEAYNPDTTQLMNRQVTGDYSNFKINTGENTVKVSGSVTKATISNYTRWL